MKATPKSCSCGMCRRGKGTKTQKQMMRHEERSFRHEMKARLRKGNEDIPPAHHGSYTD